MRDEPRWARAVTLVIWSLWAWCALTLCHELGHVAGGLAGGGTLMQLELRPWRLPHSLMAGDSYPLVTLWAGPVLGCAAPLILAAAPGRFQGLWFVAWFCLVANASYLLAGFLSGDAELDSVRMIRAGTRPWQLIAVVAVTLPLGYVKFRSACASVLSGRVPPMSKREQRSHIAALAAWLSVQTLIGALAARASGI